MERATWCVRVHFILTLMRLVYPKSLCAHTGILTKYIIHNSLDLTLFSA